MQDRRAVLEAAQPTKRFSDRVDHYQAHRPTYPSALVSDVFLDDNVVGLQPGVHVVADVGSGTGISSRLLLEKGVSVYGVEPNEQMRQGINQIDIDIGLIINIPIRATRSGRNLFEGVPRRREVRERRRWRGGYNASGSQRRSDHGGTGLPLVQDRGGEEGMETDPQAAARVEAEGERGAVLEQTMHRRQVEGQSQTQRTHHSQNMRTPSHNTLPHSRPQEYDHIPTTARNTCTTHAPSHNTSQQITPRRPRCHPIHYHSPSTRRFSDAYEALLARHCVDYGKVHHQNVIDQLEEFNRFFAWFQQRTFAHHQELDLEGLIGRTRSISYCPTEQEPAYEPLMAGVKELFGACASPTTGTLTMSYDTKVFFGALN